MSLKASLSPLSPNDLIPLTDDEVQELYSLLDTMLHELSQAAMRLDEKMARYRLLISPLIDEAVARVVPPAPLAFDTALRRLFYVDSRKAQDCIQESTRHIMFMRDTARLLQRSQEVRHD